MMPSFLDRASGYVVEHFIEMGNIYIGMEYDEFHIQNWYSEVGLGPPPRVPCGVSRWIWHVIM